MSAMTATLKNAIGRELDHLGEEDLQEIHAHVAKLAAAVGSFVALAGDRVGVTG